VREPIFHEAIAADLTQQAQRFFAFASAAIIFFHTTLAAILVFLSDASDLIIFFSSRDFGIFF
jgi:hypothetical protein